MGGVDFRNKERDVRIHTVIFGVADDGISSAGEILFGDAGDARIERGKNEVAIEAGVEALTTRSRAASGMGPSRCQRTASE